VRIEATVPDSRGAALAELASDLGLTKSQIIDEALALFLKVILEARNGRRLVTVGSGGEAACEITTPTFTQVEWMLRRSLVTVNPKGLEGIADLISHPPKPTEALKAALTEAP
jgi:hypothetical protein